MASREVPFENLELFDMLDSSEGDLTKLNPRDQANLTRRVLEFNKEIQSNTAKFDGASKKSIAQLDKVAETLKTLSKGAGVETITTYINSIKQAVSQVVNATEKINSGVQTAVQNASNNIAKTASVLQSTANSSKINEAVKKQNDLYNRAVKLVRNKQTATLEVLKKSLNIGNRQAQKIMSQMEQNGVVGKYSSGKQRAVNIAPPTRVNADRIRALRSDIKTLDRNQRAFYREISQIQDPNKRSLAYESLKYFPKSFWVNPASPSGEHHPQWQRGIGGNVAHTRDMMQMIANARNDPNSEMYKPVRSMASQKGVKISGEHYDNAILGALLHDADKFIPGSTNERGFERTDPTHESNPFGRMLPKDFQDKMRQTLGDKTFNEIKGAVESHAGKHTQGDARTAVDTIRNSLTAAMVNTADGISSDINRAKVPKGEARVAKILGNITDKSWSHVDKLIEKDLQRASTPIGDATKAGRMHVFDQWQGAIGMGREAPDALRNKLHGVGLPSGIVDDNLKGLILSGGNLGKLKRLTGQDPINVIQSLTDSSGSLSKLSFKDRFAAVDPQLLQMQYLNPKVLSHAAETLRRSSRPEDARTVQNLSSMLNEMVESIARNNRVKGTEDIYKTLRDINLQAQNSRTRAKQATTEANRTGSTRAGNQAEANARRVNRDASNTGAKETQEDKKRATENLKASASLASARKELAKLLMLEAQTARMQQTGRVTGSSRINYNPVDRSSITNRLNDIERLNNPRIAREELARIRANIRSESAGYQAELERMRLENYQRYGSQYRPRVQSNGGGSGGSGSGGNRNYGGGGSGNNGLFGMDTGGSAKGLLWNLKNSAWGMAGTLTGINSFVQLIREATSSIKDHELAVINLKRVWDGTQSDLIKAGNNLTDTAIKYGDSIENVGKIQEEWAKTGVKNFKDLSTATDVTELALNTSDITDAGSAVKYLNSALVQMQMPLSDANKLLDSWNKTADQFPADTKDFAEAYQRAAAYAKNLGLDMNDLNSIISILIERTGRSGEEVGTALRMMFSNIYIPKSVKVLEGLGIEMHQISEEGTHIEGKFRPFIDILREMNEKAVQFKSEVGTSLFSPRSVQVLEEMGIQMHQIDASGKEMTDKFRDAGQILAEIQQKGIDTKALGLPSDVSSKLMSMAKTLGETRRINFALAAIEGFDEFDKIRDISEQGVTEQYSMKKNEMTMESLYKISMQLKAAFGELAVAIGDAGILDLLKGINSGAANLLTTFSNLETRVPILNTKVRDLITVFLLYRAAQAGINKLTKEFLGTKLTTKLAEYSTSMADFVKANVLKKDIGQGSAYNTVYTKMMNSDVMTRMYADTAQREVAVTQALQQLGLAKQTDIALTQQMITTDNAASIVKAKNISLAEAEIVAMTEQYAITSTGLVFKKNEAGVYALVAGAKAEDVLTTEALAAAQVQATSTTILNNTKTGESVIVTEADTAAKIQDAAATEALAVANKASAVSSMMATMGINLLIGAAVLLAYQLATAKDNLAELTQEQYQQANASFEQLGQLRGLVNQYETLTKLIADEQQANAIAARESANHSQAISDQARESKALSEQKSELLEIQKQIAGMSPELITYYNSEGEAIAANTETMKEYIKWKEKMLELDLDSLAKDYEAYGKDQEDTIKQMEDKAKLLQIAQEALLKIPREKRKDSAELFTTPEEETHYKRSSDLGGSRQVLNLSNVIQKYIESNEEYRKYVEDYTKRTGQDLYEGGLFHDDSPIREELGNVSSLGEAIDTLAKSRKEHNKELKEEKELYNQRKQAYDTIQQMQGKEALGLNNPTNTFAGIDQALKQAKSAVDSFGVAMGDMDTISDTAISTITKNLSILERSKDHLSKSYQDALKYLKANVEGANDVIKDSNGLLKIDSIDAIKTVAQTHIDSEKDKTRETIKQNKERLDAVVKTIDVEIAKLKEAKKAYQGVAESFIGPLTSGQKRMTGPELKAAESYNKDIDNRISEANKQKAAIEDAKSQLDEKLADVNEPTDLDFSSAGDSNKYKALDNRLRTIDNVLKTLQGNLSILDTLWKEDTDNVDYLTKKLANLKDTESAYISSIVKIRGELKKLSPSADAEKYTELQDKISGYTQELYANMIAQEELKRASFQGKIQDLEKDISNVTKTLEINTKKIKDGASAYDMSKLKMDSYTNSLALNQIKIFAIQKEISRVKQEIKDSANAAKSAGNEFRRMFEGVQAKTLGEYLKELTTMLTDAKVEAGNLGAELESVVVNVLKEGYAKQLEVINNKLDEQIKKERKRHDEFVKNKQKELKTLEEQWDKDDFSDRIREFDDQISKLDTRIARLRNDTSQYAAKLRQQLEQDRSKLVDDKNKALEEKDRDDQKKKIQEDIDADTEKSDSVIEGYENEKEAASQHWQSLIDNAEFYGKGLLDAYKNNQFDILKFLYSMVPEYENVAKQSAGAYERGLKGAKSKVSEPIANIFGMSEEDYNKFIENNNKWMEAVTSGKSTKTEELTKAHYENQALRAKYNIPQGYGPTAGLDYNMSQEDYDQFNQNATKWMDLYNQGNRQSDNKEMQDLNRANDVLRDKYLMPDNGTISSLIPSKHDYGMSDADYKAFVANGQWWKDHHTDPDWNSEGKQAEYNKRHTENDELRKKYKIPVNSVPRFMKGGIMPDTGLAILEQREMALPERYTDLLDGLIDIGYSAPKNLKGDTIINTSNNVRVEKAINIENAVFQDPVDYNKIEEMAGKKLQSDLNRKGIRINR